MKPILRTLTLIAGLALPGCGSVVLPTVAALNAVSPLTADPAGFEVAAALPAGADVPVGGAIFTISMSREDTGEAIKQDFTLQRRQSADGRILFRVHPDDLDALRSLQTKARSWEDENPVGASGSFGISVSACQTSDMLDLDSTFSVSIRTLQDGPFLPLLRNVRIADALEAVDASDNTATGRICE